MIDTGAIETTVRAIVVVSHDGANSNGFVRVTMTVRVWCGATINVPVMAGAHVVANFVPEGVVPRCAVPVRDGKAEVLDSRWTPWLATNRHRRTSCR